MRQATRERLDKVPRPRDRGEQEEQTHEEQGDREKHEREPPDRYDVDHANPVHRAEADTDDQVEQRSDHEPRHAAGWHQTTPRVGQTLCQVWPCTNPDRGSWGSDVLHHIRGLDDVNGTGVGGCLHITSENRVAFPLSLHVESQGHHDERGTRRGPTGRAHRVTSPSTCRALSAQRRPRGAARTRGHRGETPTNQDTDVVRSDKAQHQSRRASAEVVAPLTERGAPQERDH